MKKTTGFYTVVSNGQEILCTLTAQLRKRQAGGDPVCKGKRLGEHTDPLAVGDEVIFTSHLAGGGVIIDRLPRRNVLARSTPAPMPGAYTFEQVIAANLDLVVPVFAAASPEPKWNMLDRYLVTAEAAGIPAMICLTKLDLVLQADGSLQPDLAARLAAYQQIGYPVVMVSACTGAGIPGLKAVLSGKISVLVGKSGVGKSSLLNALQPGLGLRTNAVNQVTGKGKHTTTVQELYRLDFGGGVIDTPGVREFGLWNLPADDLALYFPEMRPLVGTCRFGLDCTHDEEPGCAIRKAVVAGRISPHRYQSYLHMRE
ncbi:MAG TPA: ribosome small subunit-dependent GTPase A [Anaerolineaceae bacterium]